MQGYTIVVNRNICKEETPSLVPNLQISMNVPILKQTCVTKMLPVTTPKDPMAAAVLLVIKAMVKTALASYYFFMRSIKV